MMTHKVEREGKERENPKLTGFFLSVFGLTNLRCVFDAISVSVKFTATSNEQHVSEKETSRR